MKEFISSFKSAKNDLDYKLESLYRRTPPYEEDAAAIELLQKAKTQLGEILSSNPRLKKGLETDNRKLVWRALSERGPRLAY